MLHCHMPHHNMNAMSDLLGDRMMMTADTEDERALRQMQTLADRAGFEHVHHAPIAPDANQVPGFPQDAFMDMGMDEAVAKPENDGLPRNWSAMMMGMMTLVRVLPPDLYERVMRDVRSGYIAPCRLRGTRTITKEVRSREVAICSVRLLADVLPVRVHDVVPTKAGAPHA